MKDEKQPEKPEKMPNKPHLFQAGQSGNPKGRPKGSTNSTASHLREVISAALAKNDRLGLLVDALIDRAIAGDNHAASILFERYAGRPMQPEPDAESKDLTVTLRFGASPDGEDLDDDMM